MKQILLIISSIAILLLSNVDAVAQKDSTDFVTTWRTLDLFQRPSSSNDSSIHINIDSTKVYNYDIDWDNDGIFDTLGVTTQITHQYPDTGTYTIRIRGQFPRIVFGNDIYYGNVRRFNTIQDHLKLISIDQWGAVAWDDLYNAFSSCALMQYNAVDVPNLSKGPRLGGTFYSCQKFNGAIGNWDVSRVKTMENLFAFCYNFNQDLSAWRVDSVANMSRMFLNAWDFNQGLSAWNVSMVTDMNGMFFSAHDFNQDISSWDVSRVTDMSRMFEEDSAFNQDISAWRVDSVITFNSMFKHAVAFNQDISSWKIDSAFNMQSMLEGATSFNQNLGNWNISAKPRLMDRMLDFTNLSIQNYDASLIAWDARIPARDPYVRYIGAQGLKYCSADSVRTELRNKWYFTFGDQLDCITVSAEEKIAQETEIFFKIYPNPTNGSFFIEKNSNKASNEVILIYNLQGKLIQTSVMKNQKQLINLTGFNAGIYLVRVGDESKRLVVY